MRFDGRSALVTGGASGIGRQIALRLVGEGATVAVADINAAAAQIVVEEIAAAGGRGVAIETDVADVASVQRMVDVMAAAIGPPDILIHSAGIGLERSFLTTSSDEWRRIIDIDLSGTFYCCQAAAQMMIQRRYGRIVTLSSTAGVRGGTGRAAYGAAKGGVIALTKVMAVELAPYGVTANALAPGAIETDLVKRMHSPETRIVYRGGIPLDRYGTPDEVAAAALFLASEEARYVTGHVLDVDGGFLAAGVMHRRAWESADKNTAGL